MTPQEFHVSLECLGLVEEDLDKLVPYRSRRTFHQKSLEACHTFLQANNISTYEHLYRKRFHAFVDFEAQGAWCSWGDALTVAKSLISLPHDVSTKAFVLHMHARGMLDLTVLDIMDESLPDQVKLRWKAWNAALAFWKRDYAPSIPEALSSTPAL